MSDVVSPVTVATDQELAQPNWDLAKHLYFQRVPQELISQQAHVSIAALRQRIYRQDWQKQRDTVKQVLSLVVTESKAVKRECEQVSEDGAATRKELAKVLRRGSVNLAATKEPKSLQAISSQAKVARDLAESAKVVFGWEQESAGSVVNIALMQAAEVVSPAVNDNLKSIAGESIDIQAQIEDEQRPEKPLASE
jgi:hypothetical protein